MSDMISVSFTYTDELGIETSMQKTTPSDYLGGDEIDVLGDLFKDFLMAAGWERLAHKRIKWVQDDR